MPSRVIIADGGHTMAETTPVLDTSIYASGDVLFVSKEITGVFSTSGGTRYLDSVVVLDGDDQAQIFDLVFSNAAVTLGTLNAAVSISDADAAKIVGYVKMSSNEACDLINSTMYVKGAIGQIMKAASDSTSLWVAGICRGGTPTYTAAGMKLKLGFR